LGEFAFGCNNFETFTPTVTVGAVTDYGTGLGMPVGLSNAQVATGGGLGITGAWQVVNSPTQTYGFSWANPAGGGGSGDGAIAVFKLAPDLSDNIAVIPYSVAGATTITPTLTGNVHAIATFSATATLSLAAPQWPGQFMELDVCQNSAGAFTPTITGASGVTIRGTMPTFTTTANKCDVLGFSYSAANTWLLTGYIQNE
jgi:hypothetical protein